MIKCPQCKGKGTLTCEINEWGKKPSWMELTCVTCNGKGTVSKALAKAYADHQADWCRCKSTDDNIRYYGDGEHPECHKHHYRHEPGCGKIVQIG